MCIRDRVETGKEVFTARNLQIGYDRVLSEVNLTLERGQKLGIVGGNGLGKSTFLKTMMGMIQPLGGEYQYGIRVQIGYFDQQMAHYTSCLLYTSNYNDLYTCICQYASSESTAAINTYDDSLWCIPKLYCIKRCV